MTRKESIRSRKSEEKQGDFLAGSMEIAKGGCGERETHMASLASRGAGFCPGVVKSRIAAKGREGLAKILQEVEEWNLWRRQGRKFVPWLSSW
jgi:hypothetical protein